MEGLYPAGVLAGVTWEYLTGMMFYAPAIVGYDGLRIELRCPTRSDELEGAWFKIPDPEDESAPNA